MLVSQIIVYLLQDGCRLIESHRTVNLGPRAGRAQLLPSFGCLVQSGSARLLIGAWWPFITIWGPMMVVPITRIIIHLGLCWGLQLTDLLVVWNTGGKGVARG